MGYRNKTYIAADWDSDVNAVEILHHWNDSRHWSLSFHDAHEMKQARDTSLCCSIKKSLRRAIRRAILTATLFYGRSIVPHDQNKSF